MTLLIEIFSTEISDVLKQIFSSPVRVVRVWAIGWMDDLRFYILYSISVTLGQWADDYERLCARPVLDPLSYLGSFGR